MTNFLKITNVALFKYSSYKISSLIFLVVNKIYDQGESKLFN